MIHGPNVASMYSAIIDARRHEVLSSIKDYDTYMQKTDELMDFMHMIRSCKPNEFREWYELYKDAPKSASQELRVKPKQEANT